MGRRAKEAKVFKHSEDRPRRPHCGVASSVVERPAVNRKTRVRFPVTPQLAVTEWLGGGLQLRRRGFKSHRQVQLGVAQSAQSRTRRVRLALGSEWSLQRGCQLNPTAQTNLKLQGPSLARLAGCKPVALELWWFDSITLHQTTRRRCLWRHAGLPTHADRVRLPGGAPE